MISPERDEIFWILAAFAWLFILGPLFAVAFMMSGVAREMGASGVVFHLIWVGISILLAAQLISAFYHVR